MQKGRLPWQQLGGYFQALMEINVMCQAGRHLHPRVNEKKMERGWGGGGESRAWKDKEKMQRKEMRTRRPLDFYSNVPQARTGIMWPPPRVIFILISFFFFFFFSPWHSPTFPGLFIHINGKTNSSGVRGKRIRKKNNSRGGSDVLLVLPFAQHYGFNDKKPCHPGADIVIFFHREPRLA